MNLFSRAYRTGKRYLAIGIVYSALFLGPLFGENDAVAEEAEPGPSAPTACAFEDHFPFPKKLRAEIESEYQPVSGSDYSRFSLALTEIDKEGNPVYGDFARVLFDWLPDGTNKKEGGVRIPFDFGYKGKLTLYGLEHEKDEGFGARLSGSYGDWLLKGVLEGVELEGDSKDLKGLGIGRMFHSDLGETTLELWGYDRIGERFSNLFLFQRFGKGYMGGMSFTGGDKSERDFSMAFGRYDGEKSWRFHGGTALDGERVSFGASYILEPDPRHATTPFGYLNTEDGVKSYQTLWNHAMGYYPTLKLFENGRLLLQANYFHGEDSERVLAKASVRPFDLLNFDSEMLRRIHIDGVYDRRRSGPGYGNMLTGGIGMRLNGLDFYVEKAEGEGPVFFIQFISSPFSMAH